MLERIFGKYLLNGKIKVVPGMAIKVGNTGFSVEIKDVWYQHYMPDYNLWEPIAWPEKVKYGSILAYAHRSFMEWWIEKAKSDLVPEKKHDKLFLHGARREMVKFMSRMYPESIFREQEHGLHCVNLIELSRQLGQLQKLQYFADRCERRRYKMEEQN